MKKSILCLFLLISIFHAHSQISDAVYSKYKNVYSLSKLNNIRKTISTQDEKQRFYTHYYNATIMQNIAAQLKSYNFSEAQILKIAKKYFVSENYIKYNYNNFPKQQNLYLTSFKEEKNEKDLPALNAKSSVLDSISLSIINDNNFSRKIILDTTEAIEENSYYIASTNIRKLDSILDKNLSDETLTRRLITNAGDERQNWEMEVTLQKKDKSFSIMNNYGTRTSLNVDHYLVNSKNEIILIKSVSGKKRQS